MYSEELQLIRASWRLLRLVDPVVIGDVFYSKLFLDHPQLKQLFSTSREAQSRKLINMLNMIVGRLDKPDTLDAEITSLATLHAADSVLPQHYKMVNEALLWTLKQGLGKDWSEATAAAWHKYLDNLRGIMIKAAYK